MKNRNAAVATLRDTARECQIALNIIEVVCVMTIIFIKSGASISWRVSIDEAIMPRLMAMVCRFVSSARPSRRSRPRFSPSKHDVMAAGGAMSAILESYREPTSTACVRWPALACLAPSALIIHRLMASTDEISLHDNGNQVEVEAT